MSKKRWQRGARTREREYIDNPRKVKKKHPLPLQSINSPPFTPGKMGPHREPDEQEVVMGVRSKYHPTFTQDKPRNPKGYKHLSDVLLLVRLGEFHLYRVFKEEKRKKGERRDFRIRHGIVNVPSSKGTIGFSPSKNKWYGWSHRAYHGFQPGDVVKKGDCTSEYLPVGFRAKDMNDAKKMAIAFSRSVS